MKKARTYYKVLREMEGGLLVSLIAEGLAATEYKRGEAVRPPEWLAKRGYGLLVFKTKDAAERLARGEQWQIGTRNGPTALAVYSCEVEAPVNALPPPSELISLSEGALFVDSGDRWPDQSIMGGAVTLIAEVLRLGRAAQAAPAAEGP